ncbi:cell division control protein 14, SIN component-domain-containing protein, partial [Scleroderma yunnanense]
ISPTLRFLVPSRALSWIQCVTLQLDSLTSGKSSNEKECETDLNTLCAQLYQLLSIVQGIALHHESSKAFLGRRYSLEILTALLTTSRHTPMINNESFSGDPSTGLSPKKSSSVAHLSSGVLDSLLCILVDSPSALRIFEEVSGVQAVVKILKRAGTPREVRMKCLEFLYFYLMDETGSHSPAFLVPPPVSQSTPSSPVATQPNTPLARPKPNIFPRAPSRISSLSFSSATASSSSSSAKSNTSSPSLTSASSITTKASRTSISSIRAPSPVKKSYSASALPSDPHTPPNSPPPTSDGSRRTPRAIQSRSMLMLRREVDYEPQSPKKVQVSHLGVADGRSVSQLREKATRRSEHSGGSLSSLRPIDSADESETLCDKVGLQMVRTTDEKKEILSTMLGNVDALVEGVRKAGIWGLS